ncbi:hypothetical protein BOQ63_037005 [Streptomyces viridifaciens]|uniref:Uncharacterized protein n=1 Tax=Kitasatospora aureofaciens TaxID=1894 RepID=A0A8H9HD14_KITAU|nr:hypothetical protein BOQ63_037005 [Streptomyces viridifaciens]GGU57451.1 hypothetical protein GCM10010502_04940 [Kitasatospora aureofaciens]
MKGWTTDAPLGAPRRPQSKTGQTFAEARAAADQEHRRHMLIGLKVRLYMTPSSEDWDLPASL